MKKNKVYTLRRAMVDIGLFSLGVNALMLVMPLYMLQIYDRVLTSASLDTLVFISILAGSALLLLGILEAVRSIYATRVANRLDFTYAEPSMRTALAARRAGRAGVDPMRDLSTVKNFLYSRLAFVVFDVPFAPLFIGILYFVHPTLFYITFGGVIFLIALAVANQWATRKSTADAAHTGLVSSQFAGAMSRSAETVHTLGMTGNAMRVWHNHNIQQVGYNDSRASTNAFMTGLSRFVRFALQITVLGVGAYLVLNQEMTAGMIFAASIISGKGLQPIDQMIGSWRQIVEGYAAWRKLRTVNLSIGEKSYIAYGKPEGAVTVENVVYYNRREPGAKAFIKGISFGVPSGGSLGIIGKSGAGKSTLLRLIAGAIEPQSGLVRVDGNDIQTWDPEELGKHIGYVEQRVDLLPGTVAQNIARFDPDARDEDIIAAAQAANVDRVIQSFVDGYQTIVGTPGASLSGGEMQQVGLARAFFGDPQILLLDEPNASLDPEARLRFDKAITEARKNKKTIVFITQRDELLKHVDLLLAVKDGTRIDFGPRDDVLERQFGHKPAPRAANQQRAPAATPQGNPFAPANKAPSYVIRSEKK